MALITCPECNNEISDTNKKCLNCGYKLKKSRVYVFAVPIGVIAIVAAIVLIFGNGVFYGKPKELSQKAYNYGIEALEITDKYLDDIYEYDKAQHELEAVYKNLKSISEKNDNTYDYIIGIDVSLISTYMFAGTKTDVTEHRNELANSLNKSKR